MNIKTTETNYVERDQLKWDTHIYQLVSQRVKAKAQLGKDEVVPKKSFVEEELHLATIPLVGRSENNSLFIH